MLFQRSNAHRPTGRRASAVLPWIFVAAVLAAGALPIRHWLHWNDRSSQEFETLWRPLGDLRQHRSVEVIRAIDGDTFEARVRLPAQEVTTRIRLRGIDAPELKAGCAEELQMAEAATAALRDLLRQGEVAIYNIGPDKYAGRIVADVATKRVGNVSAALITTGHVRAYNGGHRNGWCVNAAR